ncbi:DUF4382 domain-containing protein [Aureicoccus marinus]|uniref:DUF4382 domain-containing protein n=1 Tax=Aureicoccus marinus TaxID=754435 RepID=UPI0011AFE482|nr:DUF4382 domain-containing protein [Aureicoccus marinus]
MEWSGSNSGSKLKLNPCFDVKGNLPTNLLLDFDLSRSFVPQGNSKTLEVIRGFAF